MASPRHPAKRPRVGYECEFVQPPKHLKDQVECAVCHMILRSPYLTSCCGNNFCKECIEFVQKNGRQSCPLCNNAEFTIMYNRAHDGLLKELQVYCTYHDIGCKWQGKLEMLDSHLNVDSKGEKQLEGCSFVEVRCSHDGCRSSLQRHLIVEHQLHECLKRPFTCPRELCKHKSTYDDIMNKHKEEECPQRPFTCEYCRTYKKTYHDVMTNHQKVCPFFPVFCPKNCTQTKMERGRVKKHLDEECPLQELECDFKFAGCKEKPPRMEMPKHLSEFDYHTRLLARQNQELMTMIKEEKETTKRIKENNHNEMVILNRQIHDQQARLREVKEQISELEVSNTAVKDDTVRRAQHKNLTQDWLTEEELDHCVEKFEKKQQDKRKQETKMRTFVRDQFQQMDCKRRKQVNILYNKNMRKLGIAVFVLFLAFIAIFGSPFFFFLLIVVMFLSIIYL